MLTIHYGIILAGFAGAILLAWWTYYLCRRADEHNRSANERLSEALDRISRADGAAFRDMAELTRDAMSLVTGPPGSMARAAMDRMMSLVERNGDPPASPTDEHPAPHVDASLIDEAGRRIIDVPDDVLLAEAERAGRVVRPEDLPNE